MGSAGHQREALHLAREAGRLGKTFLSEYVRWQSERLTLLTWLSVFLGGSDPTLCPLEGGSCCSVSIVVGDVCVLQEDTLNPEL